MTDAPVLPRQVYMVLSPRSLGYARAALSSLLQRCAEPMNLRLITDSAADRAQLQEALAEIAPAGAHACSVFAEEDLADAEADRFGAYPHLRAFRHGHPCWRKITDPLLLGGAGEELVLLDPDLYFPNRFSFEQTLPAGLTLMWQEPNCLLPPEVVRRAMDAGVPLARHVDIGVAHWRMGTDLGWLDWLLGRLGGAELPRMMHVEAIVWAAIAMREGGGYLDPRLWVCWHRTQGKRLRRKLGADGATILASEPWQQMKCFHAGGEAKWWVPGYVDSLPARSAEVTQGGRTLPFRELTRSYYEREQRLKGVLRGLGYYRVFGAKHA